MATTAHHPHLTSTADRSTWIDSIAYHGDTQTLVVFVKGRSEALLHGGVPSWLPGLLVAGTGRRSVGLAYNRLVKSQGYTYQRVEGQDKVQELKEMMQ